MKMRLVVPLFVLVLSVVFVAGSALGLGFIIKGIDTGEDPIPYISADYRFYNSQHQGWEQWSIHQLNDVGLYTFNYNPSSVETRWESYVHSPVWMPEIPENGHFVSGFSTASDRSHLHVLWGGGD